MSMATRVLQAGRCPQVQEAIIERARGKQAAYGQLLAAPVDAVAQRALPCIVLVHR